MRENLINEMLAIADVHSVDQNNWELSQKTARILREAAGELTQWRGFQMQGANKGVFVSGNDILNQIKVINEERAKNGMPPV
jgi:hypothetical protein